MLTYSNDDTRDEYYRQRLVEVKVAKENADNAAVLSWLEGYEAMLLFGLANVLWFKTCAAFGIGQPESVEEKDYRDRLRLWLTEHMSIKNMQMFLKKFDSEKDGERRQDGNVWHAELIKLFYDDGTFGVAEVECKKTNEENIDIDIRLIDKDNPCEDVNIQAWYGMSRTGHKIRHMLHTGIAPDLDGFNWDNEHKALKHKINQLPKIGQNFVIHKSPSMALTHIKSHDLLTDYVCVLQVYDTHINCYCCSSFKYKATAQKIAKVLRLKLVPLEGDWPSKPDGMSNLAVATYGFDPLEP